MSRDIDLLVDNDVVNVMPPEQTVEFWKAIGYLSTFAPTLYTRLTIRTYGKNGDLEAYYVKPDLKGPGRRYVIGAIWNKEEGKYSFHS